MPPKKATVTVSDKDKSVLLSVYRLLKWKGLKATADRLSKEAKLPESSLHQYTPELASADWARLQAAPKVGPQEDSEESSSEESDSDSDSDSEETKGNTANAKYYVNRF